MHVFVKDAGGGGGDGDRGGVINVLLHYLYFICIRLTLFPLSTLQLLGNYDYVAIMTGWHTYNILVKIKVTVFTSAAKVTFAKKTNQDY